MLQREECDDQDVYEFLTILKKERGHQQGSNSMAPITEEEWTQTVKKAKRKSASSIFSKRTYGLYKYALESNNMTKILVLFYNAVLQKGYYLNK